MTEGTTSDTQTENDTPPDSPEDENLALLVKKNMGSDAHHTGSSYVIPPTAEVHSQQPTPLIDDDEDGYETEMERPRYSKPGTKRATKPRLGAIKRPTAQLTRLRALSYDVPRDTRSLCSSGTGKKRPQDSNQSSLLSAPAKAEGKMEQPILTLDMRFLDHDGIHPEPLEYPYFKGLNIGWRSFPDSNVENQLTSSPEDMVPVTGRPRDLRVTSMPAALINPMTARRGLVSPGTSYPVSPPNSSPQLYPATSPVVELDDIEMPALAPMHFDLSPSPLDLEFPTLQSPVNMSTVRLVDNADDTFVMSVADLLFRLGRNSTVVEAD